MNEFFGRQDPSVMMHYAKVERCVPELIVFAGTHAQATHYLLTNNIDRRAAIIATDVRSISGLHDMPVVYVGTYYERPDHHEIEAHLKSIRGR